MFRSRAHRDQGFTLVELLVVVIVVGILVAVAVPAYMNQRDKSAVGATKATMRNHVLLIMSARENRQQAMKNITTNCSECPCRSTTAGLKIDDPNFAASPCGSSWRTYVDRLAAAAGEPVSVVERMATDGWGYPILMDENEGEFGTCGVASSWDLIRSPGRDHTILGSPDNIALSVPPSGACTPNPVAP